ncbi:hypothetical protein BGY98DRAFT_985721 [Russula aff. rugulosa BPL654]|nr:hypothetical protein BGY98DRAFT_985721 [Russula aff. rugulosa BPL654]
MYGNESLAALEPMYVHLPCPIARPFAIHVHTEAFCLLVAVDMSKLAVVTVTVMARIAQRRRARQVPRIVDSVAEACFVSRSSLYVHHRKAIRSSCPSLVTLAAYYLAELGCVHVDLRVIWNGRRFQCPPLRRGDCGCCSCDVCACEIGKQYHQSRGAVVFARAQLDFFIV